MIMNASNNNLGRTLRTLAVSLCAACAVLTNAAYGQDEGVQVRDMGTVDIAVVDTDLAQVLQMLSLRRRWVGIATLVVLIGILIWLALR